MDSNMDVKTMVMMIMFQLLSAMMTGLRAIGFAAAAMEVVSDSQAAAFGLYDIIDAVSAS